MRSTAEDHNSDVVLCVRQRGIELVRFSLSDFRPCFAKSLIIK